jgi:hypothetical protein
LNSPPPPFSFIPPHIPGIASTGIIFPFTCTVHSIYTYYKDILKLTSNKRKSAGTLSPTERQTVSPGTKSRASVCSNFPSRTL